jgi:hypothetical protein
MSENQQTGKTYGAASIWESLRDDPRNDAPAGTQVLEFGFAPDPEYDVLTEDGPKRITYEKVCDIDLPGEMTKEEIKDYVQEEVLPLE